MVGEDIRDGELGLGRVGMVVAEQAATPLHHLLEQGAASAYFA
jgi:hypothetical protein